MSKNTGKRAALAAETAHERFLRMAKPGNPDECWEWPGNRIAAGYGTFGHHYRPHYVHRTSYEVHKGPIPDRAPHLPPL